MLTNVSLIIAQQENDYTNWPKMTFELPFNYFMTNGWHILAILTENSHFLAKKLSRRQYAASGHSNFQDEISKKTLKLMALRRQVLTLRNFYYVTSSHRTPI